MRRTGNTRGLFTADATFEAIFGTLLLAGALGGTVTPTDVPVAKTVIVCVGIAFLCASASQFLYFIDGPRRVLLELAIGNAGMGAAGLIWLLADEPFSALGAAILSAASVWKLAIGFLQARSLISGLRDHHRGAARRERSDVRPGGLTL